MTQKCVEMVIGKLASDEELRAAFRRDRTAAIRALQLQGLELTPLEICSLARLSVEAFDQLAVTIDPRLKKVSLKDPRR